MVCNVLNANYNGFTSVQEIQFLGNYGTDDLRSILYIVLRQWVRGAYVSSTQGVLPRNPFWALGLLGVMPFEVGPVMEGVKWYFTL